MTSHEISWTSAIYACVEDNYRSVLYRWNTYGHLEPGGWEELLCWAGQLRWNAMVSGLSGALASDFPNKPGYPEIMGRLRGEGMYSLANSLDTILKTLPDYPECVADIGQSGLDALHFPMREGWERGFVVNSILVDEIPPQHLDLYHAYRGLAGTGALFEIYRFLDNLKASDESVFADTDLARFKVAACNDLDLDVD